MKPRASALCHRLACVALALAAGLPAARADLIVLKDGREYTGELVRATPAEIVFRRDGRDESFARADVVHVRLQQARAWSAFTRVEQVPDDTLRAAAAAPPTAREFPGAAAVTLLQHDRVELRTPQTWSLTSRWLGGVLQEEGERISVRQIAFFRRQERAEILHAVCVRPDGSLLHLQDTAVHDEAPYAQLPRCDQVVVRRFALPEGKPGNLFAVAVHRERHEALPGAWYYDEFLFGGVDPCREVVVDVVVPDGITLRWQLLNNDAGEVRCEQRHEGTATHYRWRRTGAPLLLPEPMMPPLADCVPRLVVSTFPGSWNDAAADLAQIALPAAPPWPAALSPAPAAETLWEQVSRHVQEVSVPLEVTAFTAAPPEATLRERQGTDLDRVALLRAWLAAAQPALQPALALVRPRAEGRLAPEVPNRSAFQVPALTGHPTDAAAWWVTGDDACTPAEMVLPLAGSPALVAGRGLATVPAPPLVPGTDSVVRLRLHRDGEAVVEHRTVYRGADARALRGWRRLTAEQIRNAVDGRVRAIDARAEQIRFRVEGDVTANTPELELVLEYRIPRFADVRDGLLSLKLPWLEFDATAVGRANRRLPLVWGGPRRERVSVEIIPPRGYTLHAGIEPLSRRLAGVSLEATREPGENCRVEVVYDRSATELPASDYPALKELFESRAALGRAYWLWHRPTR